MRVAALALVLLLLGATPCAADDALWALLKAGGQIVLMRHATAPGTFDPPGMRLDDCGSQRNLDEQGRDESRRIGAAFGRPDETIFDIDGDGSFEMTLNEIATAVSNGLKIKVAILNNGRHGMVRQWQDLFYQGRHAQSEISGAPDFAKLAEAYGAVGMTISKREEVRPALEKAMKTPKMVIMNFLVEEEEDCWPMIAPGKPANEMLGTYEALQKDGAVAQPRKFKDASEELSLS
jgi:hypothetical protein